MNTLFGTENKKCYLALLMKYECQIYRVIVRFTHLECVTDYAAGSAAAGRVFSGPVVV